MAQFFIVVCTASCSERNGRINAVGEPQMHDLYQLLKIPLDGRGARLACAKTQSALDSATALNKGIALERFDACDILRTDDREPNLPTVLEILSQKANDIHALIVVVDARLAEILPAAFAELKFKFDIPHVRLKPGQARIVSLREKRADVVG